MPSDHRIASRRRLLRPVRTGVLTGALAAACSSGGGDSPAGPVPPPPPSVPALAIEGSLTPGGSVRLTGVAEGGQVTIDGAPVAVTPDGANAVRLVVPTLGPCEADGRSVTVAVTAAGVTRTLVAPLAVPGAITLAAGESRLLDGPSLACLQLARGDAQYALTLVDLRADTTIRPAARFVVRGNTAGAALAAMGAPVPMAVRRETSPLLGAADRVALEVPTTRVAAAGAAVAVGPVPVDPRLATAGQGDEVLLPQGYWTPGWQTRSCTQEGATVPQRPFVVVAASGKVIVVAPKDEARLSMLASGALQASLVEAARLLDAHGLAALRRLLWAGVNWYPTAGGRVIIALQPLDEFGIEGVAYGQDNTTRLRCANSAQLNAVTVGIRSVVKGSDARWVASTAVHEFTHVFDLAHDRGTGQANPGSSAGWAAEALARNAEDLFVRFAESNAGRPGVTVTTGAALGLGAPWGRLWLVDRSVAGRSPYSQGGRYEQGGQLVLAAREMAGDAALDAAPPPGGTLYERLTRRFAPSARQWTAQDLGEAVGLSGEEFLDKAAAALVTDDQMSAAPGGPGSLPQITSWENTGMIERAVRQQPELQVGVGEGRDETLSTGGGGHLVRYLQAGVARGIAASVTPAQGATTRGRVTRLR